MLMELAVKPSGYTREGLRSHWDNRKDLFALGKGEFEVNDRERSGTNLSLPGAVVLRAAGG